MDINSLLKYKTNPDNDNVRFKEIIKSKLVNNEAIIYLLNNEELQKAEAEPSEYFNVNILPYYILAPVQSNVQNYICYEVSFDEENRFNEVLRYGQITFYILCNHRNIIEKSTGIARHDLLAALITDEFAWSKCFGQTIKLVSDRPSVVDNNFSTRTLVFEGQFTNSIVSTDNTGTRVITGGRR